jgi:predicted permease
MTPVRSFFLRKKAEFASWFRALLNRSQVEADMEAELADHFDRLMTDLIRAGHSRQEAARRARIALGPALKSKEEMRASLGLRWCDELAADLRFAVRILLRSPGFTAIAAVSLALAIGANTAIFSAARQILYERLDVPRASELRLLTWTGTEKHVAVHHIYGDYDKLSGGLVTSPVFSYPAYEQLRAQNRFLGDLLAFRETGMNMTVREDAQHILVEIVSGNYYSVLGVRPQLGRAIEPSDDAVNSAPVAVISDALWQREFARSPAALGQVIKLNDKPVTIVGVNPRNFTGAKSALESETPAAIVPLALQPILTPSSDGISWLTNPQQWWVNVMGRAKPGESNETAQAALDTQLSAIVRATMPVRAGEDIPRLVLRDGSRGLFEQEQIFLKPMAVLMTLVGFVLLLACVNIANLMLARGERRLREMSVRLALGAGRARILRQLLVESLLLAALGGTLGIAMGYLGRIAIPQLTQSAWQHAQLKIHFDWSVFAYTAGITVLTGTLFGIAPALSAARVEVTHGLKEGAQTTTRRRKGMGGKALVGVQIALSTLLVIGAGLFIRTLAGLNSVDPGFRTHNLLLAQIDLPRNRYPAGRDIALHQKLEQAISAVPGVESVAPAMDAYLSDDLSATDFLPEGESYDPNKRQGENYNAVGIHFFSTLGIPIVAGRAFGEQDTASSPHVGIINLSLARIRFPGQNPIGKRFATSAHDMDGHGGKLAADWIQIVGVCADTRYSNLRDDPPPQFFLPYVQQSEVGSMVYEIHTAMKPEAILPSLRRAVQTVDPDLPLVNVRTQDRQIAMDLNEERLFVALTSGFGFLALALACVGIYGIMAYSVANRRNEIGIRLALGAQPNQVRGMILRESTWLAVAGIVAGTGAALPLTRLVKSMLYGIQPWDPVTIVGGVLILLAVALAASWLPARRAAPPECSPCRRCGTSEGGNQGLKQCDRKLMAEACQRANVIRSS